MHKEAMELIWAEFTESPTLENYQLLKSHAELAGNWQEWRDKALSNIREYLDGRRSGTKTQLSRWYRPADNSLLVEIFLWEGNAEQAWKEATDGGCSDCLWIDLAELREDEHPEDALRVYMDQIEPLLKMTGNDIYDQIIWMLQKVEKLMLQLDRSDQFNSYIANIRHTQKRKRNLMKLLDYEKWG
jgi:uncharacterized Zn finger protein